MTNMKFQDNQIMLFGYFCIFDKMMQFVASLVIYKYTYRMDAAEVRPFPPPLPSAVLTIGGVRHTFVDAAVFDIRFRSPIL